MARSARSAFLELVELIDLLATSPLTLMHPSSALSSAALAPADALGLTDHDEQLYSKRRKAAQPIDRASAAAPAFWPSAAAANDERQTTESPVWPRLKKADMHVSSASLIHQDNLITNTTDREDVDRLAELMKPGSDSHNILSADKNFFNELDQATVMFWNDKGKRTRGSNLSNHLARAQDFVRKMREDANVLSDFSHSLPKDDQAAAFAEAKAAKAAEAKAATAAEAKAEKAAKAAEAKAAKAAATVAEKAEKAAAKAAKASLLQWQHSNSATLEELMGWVDPTDPTHPTDPTETPMELIPNASNGTGWTKSEDNLIRQIKAMHPSNTPWSRFMPLFPSHCQHKDPITGELRYRPDAIRHRSDRIKKGDQQKELLANGLGTPTRPQTCQYCRQLKLGHSCSAPFTNEVGDQDTETAQLLANLANH